MYQHVLRDLKRKGGQSQKSGSKTLFVGNFSFDVGEDDVVEFFKEAGEVVDVRLAKDDEGCFEGFGHVEFSSKDVAQKAYEMNGQELLGRGVGLDFARERGASTPYSGLRLLSMLEDYTILRQEKEQERKRHRDQKRLQGQLIAEQEALFGSKPSPCKPQTAKKMPRTSMGGSSRRLSLGGGSIMQSQKPDLIHSAKPTRPSKKADDHAVLSPATRGLDVAGLPIKKLSFYPSKASEVETPRKPFALLPVNNIPSTPSQPIFTQAEEKKSPMVAIPIPIPKTPMTVSVPMQVAVTPAPASITYDKTPARRTEESIEYSFEERRLARNQKR